MRILREKYIKFSCKELESEGDTLTSLLEVTRMDPPKKVYQKKRKTPGSTSRPKLPSEPTQKKSKNQPIPEPQPDTQHLDLLATEAIPADLSPEAETEVIRELVQELNDAENVERDESEERGAEENVETEGEDDDEPYDDFKFASRKAQKNFERYWSKRSTIVERGILLNHFQTEEFQLKQNFEQRGWIKWAQFSGVAVVPIVQEFYANITSISSEEKDCIETKVRGVYFKITPKDVRKFFGLKEEKHPQFPFAAEEALDKNALAKILTGKGNAEWGHKNKLAKNRLTPKFNSLHFLACSQLNPVLNTSEISYEKGLLLYAIDANMRIELGQIIWESIASNIKARKGVISLPFAGFITKFVCKKKVISELGEQVAKPLGPITASSCERSVAHKKGKGEASKDESIDKMNDKLDGIVEAIAEIRDTQFVIKREVQEQGRRIAAIENNLKLFLAASNVETSSSSHGDPPAET